MTTRNDIERVLWKACDSFRGKIDSSRYKDYILSMLFVKYLSDVTLERRALYMEQYDGDERRVERAMSRERFSLQGIHLRLSVRKPHGYRDRPEDQRRPFPHRGSQQRKAAQRVPRHRLQLPG